MTKTIKSFKKAVAALFIASLFSVTNVFADNVINLEGFCVAPGQTVDGIAVTLKNSNPVAVLQFEIVLPQGVKLVANNGEIFQRTNRLPTTYNNRVNFEWTRHNSYEDGHLEYLITMYSSGLNAIQGDEGAIMTFSLKADENYDTANGIQIKNIKGADRAGDPLSVVPSVENGIFPNEAQISFDLNKDGKVNVLDLQLEIDAINAGEYAIKYDFVTDGKLNVLDLQALIDEINKQ